MELRDLAPWHLSRTPARGIFPFDTTLDSLHREFDRMFDSFWRGMGPQPFASSIWGFDGAVPAIDQSEDEMALSCRHRVAGNRGKGRRGQSYGQRPHDPRGKKIGQGGEGAALLFAGARPRGFPPLAILSDPDRREQSEGDVRRRCLEHHSAQDQGSAEKSQDHRHHLEVTLFNKPNAPLVGVWRHVRSIARFECTFTRFHGTPVDEIVSGDLLRRRRGSRGAGACL